MEYIDFTGFTHSQSRRGTLMITQLWSHSFKGVLKREVLYPASFQNKAEAISENVDY